MWYVKSAEKEYHTTVVDPGFPVGGGGGGTSTSDARCRCFLVKMYAKMKESGTGGGGGGGVHRAQQHSIFA